MRATRKKNILYVVAALPVFYIAWHTYSMLQRTAHAIVMIPYELARLAEDGDRIADAQECSAYVFKRVHETETRGRGEIHVLPFHSQGAEPNKMISFSELADPSRKSGYLTPPD